MGQYGSWKELLEVTVQELHGAANSNDKPTAEDYGQSEQLILQRAQRDSFQQEYSLLKADKPVPSSSRLRTLSPELDEQGELIRVGGRLRRAEGLELTTLHPVILDPGHRVTVDDGGQNLQCRRWQTCHQPVCAFSSLPSILRGWTALGHLRSKWAGTGRRDGG